MAKRRKPRPTGPPPARSPKMERVAAGTERPKASGPRGPEPRPPSIKGVLVRAVVIAAIYGLFLLVVLREKPLTSLVVTLFGFALMVPLGMMFDRMRYRSQMKRWRERGGVPAPAKATRAHEQPAAPDADDA